MKSEKPSISKYLTAKELLELAYQRERAFPGAANLGINLAKAYKDYQQAIIFLNEIAETEKPSDDQNKKALEQETLEKETFDFPELCRRSNSDYIPHPNKVTGHTKTATSYIKRLQEHYQKVYDELEEQVRVPKHMLDHESQFQSKCRKAFHYVTADLQYIKSFNQRVENNAEDFSRKDISRISHMSRRYQEKKLTIEEMVKQIELEEQAAEIF